MNKTDLQELRIAAQSTVPVSGLTHDFYKYPARFSPVFASTAIRLFSRPGDLVLDPFMGGGTTVVEGMVAGRRTVGSDVNSLAVFLTKVKTTILSTKELRVVQAWIEADDLRAAEAVALFCYQAKKWTGSFAAALGGLDTLVFAGGIGENSPLVRTRICDGLQFLGIELNESRNVKATGVISTDASRAMVRVIRTDEEQMIAQSTCRVLGFGDARL